MSFPQSPIFSGMATVFCSLPSTQGSQTRASAPGAGVTDGCELRCGCWQQSLSLQVTALEQPLRPWGWTCQPWTIYSLSSIPGLLQAQLFSSQFAFPCLVTAVNYLKCTKLLASLLLSFLLPSFSFIFLSPFIPLPFLLYLPSLTSFFSFFLCS